MKMMSHVYTERPEGHATDFGYVTLGSTEKTDSGFHGKLTRVQAWSRALDTNREIPLQVKSLNLDENFKSCKDAPILFDGLILRWSGYERTIGGVERIMPSICGERKCPPGYVGPDCSSQKNDKIPPTVTECPGDLWVATRNGSAFVTWDTPKFTDNQAVSTLNIQKPSLSPGQALHWGTYEISYIAYDDAGNSATCAFKIYVVEEFCPPLVPPEGGTQSCEDWGPGGIIKVCRIECEDGKKFSQPVPQFYTCGAEGFWRPNPNKNPASQFVYPACSAATPAQKIFKIKLQYLAQVLCSKTGKGVLKDKIINALQGLNEEWRFSACDKISQGECKDFNVDINCVKKASNKVKRQANEVDQKYDLEISFPTLDGEDAININDGRRKKIERLLQEIIIDENNLSVDNILPGTLLNPASVDITQSFSCPLGSVVIDSTCVPCPHGTFYDETSDTCVSCPVGSYNSEEAQVQCNICPEINGVAGTTEKEGSIKLSDCKETCPAGQFFDKIVGLCRPCGNGKYQPDEGKFFCYMCGVGLTTRTTEALTRDECRPECEDGHQIDLQGNCIPCLLGQYRQKGVDLGCKRCPKGFTTSKSGASSASDCSLPICLAGHYLDALTNECTMCQPGFYQPDDQQTECLPCPQDTTTKREGATSKDECTNRCKVVISSLLNQ